MRDYSNVCKAISFRCLESNNHAATVMISFVMMVKLCHLGSTHRADDRIVMRLQCSNTRFAASQPDEVRNEKQVWTSTHAKLLDRKPVASFNPPAACLQVRRNTVQANFV